MKEISTRVKKDGILRVYIEEVDGSRTGEYIDFDMDDVTLLARIQECVEKHKKNLEWIRNQLLIIEKKQDHKGKKMLTKNQEEEIKASIEYYKREEEALDLFLGKGGTKKMINHRALYFSMFDDIFEMLNPIMSQLESLQISLVDKVKEKYSKKEDNILE